MHFLKEADVIHCVGVGGIGMSGLARLLMAEGKKVSGSDSTPSPLTQRLQDEGLLFTRDIPEAVEVLVYSEAVPFEDAERAEGRKRGLPELNYFQALGAWAEDKRVIALAGTHGKTTTTAMLGEILIAANLDPTVLVGSTVADFGGSNVRFGKSDLFVVEACEYRRNFLSLKPSFLGILNVEWDHPDFFPDFESYKQAFADLAAQSEHVFGPDYAEYTGPLGVFGAHNRKNAGLAMTIALALGVSMEVIEKALSTFRGTWRRMEYKGEWQGAKMYDDYAHHPTEIRASLAALHAEYPGKRIVAVFEPHQYSRTRHLLADFGSAFAEADHVIIPGIYQVRDSQEDVAAVSGKSLADEIAKHHGAVEFCDGDGKVVERLGELLGPDSVLVVMGAGPIDRVFEVLV